MVTSVNQSKFIVADGCETCRQPFIGHTGGICAACLNTNLEKACKSRSGSSSYPQLASRSNALGSISVYRQIPGMPKAVLVPVELTCGFRKSEAAPLTSLVSSSDNPFIGVKSHQPGHPSSIKGADSEAGLQGGSELSKVSQGVDALNSSNSNTNGSRQIVEGDWQSRTNEDSFKPRNLFVKIPCPSAIQISRTLDTERLTRSTGPILPIHGASANDHSANVRYVNGIITSANAAQRSGYQKWRPPNTKFETDLMERLLEDSRLQSELQPLTRSLIRKFPVRPTSPTLSPPSTPLWKRRRLPEPLALRVRAITVTA